MDDKKSDSKCATYCACYYRCCRPFLLRATGGCSGQLEKEMLPLPEGVSTSKSSQQPKSLLARILRIVFRFLLFFVIIFQMYVFFSWYCGGQFELFHMFGVGHYSEKVNKTLDEAALKANIVLNQAKETISDKLNENTSDKKSNKKPRSSKSASSTDNSNNNNANIQNSQDNSLDDEDDELKSAFTTNANNNIAVIKPKSIAYSSDTDPIRTELPWMNKLGTELWRATQKKKMRHQPRYRYKPPKVMIKSYGSEIDAMKFVKNAVRTSDFLSGEDFDNDEVDKDELIDPDDPEVKKLVEKLRKKHDERQRAEQARG